MIRLDRCTTASSLPVICLAVTFAGIIAGAPAYAGDEQTTAPASADAGKVPAANSAAQIEQVWVEKGVPLLTSYCVDCHNADMQEAEVDLASHIDLDAITAARPHWEKVLERVRFGSMPPEDAEQPTADERAQLVMALETAIYGSGCDLDPKPGHVTVRRLNRAEYNNTIRDIFGQDLRPADAFPSDEVGAGFDNNGDVLSLPPMLFEKYMAAAEDVANKVILDPDEIERIKVERSGDTLHSLGKRFVGSFYKFYMLEDGIIWAQFDAPYDGEYELRVAGSSGKEGETSQVAVYNTSGELTETVKFKYSDGGGSNSESFRLNLTAGEHRFFCALVKPETEAAKHLDAVSQLTEEVLAEAWAQEGKSLEVDRKFDRDAIAFAIKSLTLEGPRGIPDQLLPPGHRKLITKYAYRSREVDDAARPGLAWLLRRAFRGPVDDETVNRYVELVQMAEEREDNFARAMRVGVAAILVSPRFLFRVELPPGDVEAGDATPLSSEQLATRLSYFLWSSTPDEELLNLAQQGKLNDDGVLVEQVARMLADPKAESLADNFAAQWLGLRNLATVQPDETQFKAFDDGLREAMRQETRLLFLDVMENNRSILDLLDAPETFLNDQLAEHYGIEGVEGSEFRKVSLADTSRRGILTHASVLTLTSNPTRTSPVKRGKWILENVLGTPPPEPPAGVPQLEESAQANPNASLREQLELHRTDPTCASCHRTMDTLGFGFEQFNVIGGYREKEGEHPIDASGELPGGLKFTGPLELISILRKKNGEQFAQTTIERLLTFALGRELRFADRCLVDDIVRKAQTDDFRFATLVREIVVSPAFRLQQAEGN